MRASVRTAFSTNDPGSAFSPSASAASRIPPTHPPVLALSDSMSAEARETPRLRKSSSASPAVSARSEVRIWCSRPSSCNRASGIGGSALVASTTDIVLGKLTIKCESAPRAGREVSSCTSSSTSTVCSERACRPSKIRSMTTVSEQWRPSRSSNALSTPSACASSLPSRPGALSRASRVSQARSVVAQSFVNQSASSVVLPDPAKAATSIASPGPTREHRSLRRDRRIQGSGRRGTAAFVPMGTRAMDTVHPRTEAAPRDCRQFFAAIEVSRARVRAASPHPG